MHTWRFLLHSSSCLTTCKFHYLLRIATVHKRIIQNSIFSPDNCTDVGEKENIHVVSAEEVVQDILEVSLVTDDHALTNLEEANITCPSDSMSWIDGECYQLASTGPCEDSQWFVLDSIVDGRPVVKCKDRKCEEESVWFSKACSCVPLDLEDSNVTLKTGMESLCQEGTQIVVSPYGDGVCAVNIEKSLDNRLENLVIK